jgi:hypothetical protein
MKRWDQTNFGALRGSRSSTSLADAQQLRASGKDELVGFSRVKKCKYLLAAITRDINFGHSEFSAQAIQDAPQRPPSSGV